MCELLRASSRISLQKESEGGKKGERREEGREKEENRNQMPKSLLNADSSLSKTENSQPFGVKL